MLNKRLNGCLLNIRYTSFTTGRAEAVCRALVFGISSYSELKPVLMISWRKKKWAVTMNKYPVYHYHRKVVLCFDLKKTKPNETKQKKKQKNKKTTTKKQKNKKQKTPHTHTMVSKRKSCLLSRFLQFHCFILKTKSDYFLHCVSHVVQVQVYQTAVLVHGLNKEIHTFLVWEQRYHHISLADRRPGKITLDMYS